MFDWASYIQILSQILLGFGCCLYMCFTVMSVYMWVTLPPVEYPTPLHKFIRNNAQYNILFYTATFITLIMLCVGKLLYMILRG